MDKYQWALEQAMAGQKYWDKKAAINQVFFETKHFNKNALEEALRKHDSLKADIMDEADNLVVMLDNFVKSFDE
jgi:predicted phosphohydrolase